MFQCCCHCHVLVYYIPILIDSLACKCSLVNFFALGHWCLCIYTLHPPHALPLLPPQLLGLDYLIDANLHPWLLEVNGTPSLAVEHEDKAVEQLIHTQKVGACGNVGFSSGWMDLLVGIHTFS